MWLGATDVVKEGTWIWESSKTIATYTKWGGGEPNNCCGGENCLHFNSVWNDLSCDATLNVMCEVVFPC